jgi:hypothetical protein
MQIFKSSYIHKTQFWFLQLALFMYLSSLLLTSCVYGDRVDNRKIKINNNSTLDVYFVKSESGSLKKPFYDENTGVILRDSVGLVHSTTPSWDMLIDSSKDHKLSVFIVSKDSVDKYGWDYIYKKNIYIRRYLIDMNYLEKNKWTIVYK